MVKNIMSSLKGLPSVAEMCMGIRENHCSSESLWSTELIEYHLVSEFSILKLNNYTDVLEVAKLDWMSQNKRESTTSLGMLLQRWKVYILLPVLVLLNVY